MIDFSKITEEAIKEGHITKDEADLGEKLGQMLYELQDAAETQKLAGPQWDKFRNIVTNYVSPSLALAGLVGLGVSGVRGMFPEKEVESPTYEVEDAISGMFDDEQSRELAFKAYETLSRFAPDIARDPIASKSVIKHMVDVMKLPSQRGAIDFKTIEMLAQAQKNVTDMRTKRKSAHPLETVNAYTNFAKNISNIFGNAGQGD